VTFWPSSDEVYKLLKYAMDPKAFRENYGNVDQEARQAVERRQGHQGPGLRLAQEHLHRAAAVLRRLHDGAQDADIRRAGRARVMALFGDSITTDHISPAGSIKEASPTGTYLKDNGVQNGRFQQLRRARRGNHEVMMAGRPVATCASRT